MAREHALRHRLRRGRHAHPVAVGRDVGVARRGGAGAAAGARLQLAGEAEVGGLRAEDGQRRLEQRQVDHLAGAALHARAPQRHHRGAGAVQAGRHVAEEHRRQHRLAVGEAVHRGEARVAFDQRAEAGLVAIRPGLAPARHARDHELGIERRAARRGRGPSLRARRGESSRRARRPWRRAA